VFTGAAFHCGKVVGMGEGQVFKGLPCAEYEQALGGGGCFVVVAFIENITEEAQAERFFGGDWREFRQGGNVGDICELLNGFVLSLE